MLRMLMPYSLTERGHRISNMLNLERPLSRSAVKKVYVERKIKYTKTKVYRRVNWTASELLKVRKAFVNTVTILENSGVDMFYYDQASTNIWSTIEKTWQPSDRKLYTGVAQKCGRSITLHGALSSMTNSGVPEFIWSVHIKGKVLRPAADS